MSLQRTLVFFGAAILTLGSLAVAQEKKSGADKLKLSGDFRYRHETQLEEELVSGRVGRKPDRHRHRFRLRLSGTAEITPALDAIARLASGNGSPRSANQDFTGSFAPKPVLIEQAYFEYRLPTTHRAASLRLRGGKFPVPFETTSLVWDNEITTEGLNLTFGAGCGAHKLFAHAGGFWADEQARSPDRGLLAGQGGVKSNWSGTISSLLCAAYYDYTQMRHNRVLFDPAKPYGNRADRGSGRDSVNFYYRNAFDLLQLHGWLQWKGDDEAAMLFGDFVSNTAVGDEKLGWLAGFSLQNGGKVCRWELAYDYRVLEADAVVGAFTDSDFGNGHTNSRGHRATVAFWPQNNVQLRAVYYNNRLDPHGSNLTLQTFHLDFEVRF